ncbi:MAG: adenylosuccinate lyase [Gemmatimonadota bacterium]|nr:MAG: adenylosuccinate lyase [Gemmatimonadota bacterium]
MIDRYTRPEMGALFTDQRKFETWLEIEIAILEALVEKGEVPAADLAEIKAKATVDAERISEIERETNHDVVAFLRNVSEGVGDAARWVHLGVTSSDVVDTAWAILLKEAGERLIAEVDKLRAVIARRAIEHRDTPMIGRTHGVHAEPTTFGLKLAVYWTELGRDRLRLERAVETMSHGKISGAVGTFAHLDPDVEESACRHLGLTPAPISTQILQRDRHAEFAFALAVTGATLEKIALEVRHLHRTEVREVQEQFTSKQTGSSSMPHKRNPILCERICGLARILRGNLQVALENVALWHERDISHSSAERVVLPDGCILLDYLLAKTTSLVDNLVVLPENMMLNLEKMRGLVFSQNLMLDLVRAGRTRGEAYRAVQRAAARVWDENLTFREVILQDPEITETLSVEEIDAAVSLQRSLRNAPHVFERIGILDREEALAR